MVDTLYTESEKYDILAAECGTGQDGKRLDAALAELFPQISRSRAQRLIEAECVKVNGTVRAEKKHPVHAGEPIEMRLRQRQPLVLKPEPIELSIVYEDDSLIVVDKPRGIVVHPAPGNHDGTLVSGLLHHIGETDGLSSIAGAHRPGIVHRIDKNTSGLLVVAKHDQAHRYLSAQLSSHQMARRYRAIVLGGFKQDSGTVDAPLGRDPNHRKRQAVMRDGTGRRAVTHYQVVEHLQRFSLLELQLETGRTHQIRVHMAYIGHPVLGDDLYGSARGDGQYLHAVHLGFKHPETGEHMDFTSPLPLYFTGMLEKLRRQAGIR